MRAEARRPDAENSVDTDLPLWSHSAWLTLEGGNATTLPLDSPVIRLGRHHDNDVRLPDASVHRHHAVIERVSDEAFVIRDLSGRGGGGVLINGQRRQEAQLVDGDLIELGRARLKFESALA